MKTILYLPSGKNDIDDAYEKYLSKVARLPLAKEHNILELVDYIIEVYDAKPYKKSITDYNQFMRNVIGNISHETPKSTKELLTQIHNDNKELEYFLKNRHKDMSEVFKPYKLKPHFYQLVFKGEVILVDLEEKTCFIDVKDNQEIYADLIKFLGISQEDVSRRSQRFVRYSYVLNLDGYYNE